MLSYVTEAIFRNSNYSILNIDNLYKFHIMSMMIMNDAEKHKYLDNMKFQLGISHYNEFKMHIFRKFPNHELLEYFKT